MPRIFVRNKYLENEGVRGATVEFDPPERGAAGIALLSGVTNRWKAANLAIRALPNGRHLLRVTPAHTTADAVGSNTAAMPNLPARIYRSICRSNTRSALTRFKMIPPEHTTSSIVRGKSLKLLRQLNTRRTDIPAKAGHAVKLWRYPGACWVPDQACPGHDRGSGMTTLPYLIAVLFLLFGGSMPVHAACQTDSVYNNCFVTDVDPDDVLNVRASPKRLSPIVGLIPSDGQAVHKLEVAIFPGKSDWFKVCYKDIIGWVNAKYLICRLSPQAAEKIISHQAKEVLLSLARRDLKQFSKHVHPLKGVRFSPYAYVVPNIDLRIGAKEIAGLFKDKEKKLWGYYDGSGFEIRLTFEEYFSKFVCRHDFTKAEQIGYNTAIGSGNTRNNLFEAYPHSIFVEYYLDGLDPRTNGTEWASLRLVFEELEGKWYIVGVVYSRWTI